MKVEKIIEKFGLREKRLVRGNLCQKMEDYCIQKFVDGDPSKTGKYLEWMFYQAGGGRERLQRSIKQWQEGEHNEMSICDQLRDCFIATRMGEWKDDSGQTRQPVSRKVAEEDWAVHEEALKWYHVYGDEEYVEQGCFGFYCLWPGANDQYSTIVGAVQRFHRHAQALRARGHSTDLSLASYPNVIDLLKALREIAAAELKADVDYDLVYSDEWVQVYCPYNIGASLKLGISKWCTSNESMFMAALTADGKNRWKEYVSGNALYYCHFRQIPLYAANGAPMRHVAIQVPFPDTDSALCDPDQAVAYAKYWDGDDKSQSLEEFLAVLTKCCLTRLDHMTSFRYAIKAISVHYKTFNRERVVESFSP